MKLITELSNAELIALYRKWKVYTNLHELGFPVDKPAEYSMDAVQLEIFDRQNKGTWESDK